MQTVSKLFKFCGNARWGVGVYWSVCDQICIFNLIESVNISHSERLTLSAIKVIFTSILTHCFPRNQMALNSGEIPNFSQLIKDIRTPRTMNEFITFCFFILTFTSVLAQSSPSIQIEQAQEAYFAGNYGKSANLFRPLAESGNAEAQYYLGLIYKSDQFPKKDINTAISYLLSAADQNHSSAMWQLGQIYENGEGVQRDLLTATDWYRKSEKSSPTSAIGIQFMKTKNGTLVNQNSTKVIDDLTRAAESGDAESLYKLGKIYDSGVLTQGNESEAFKWYLKAATKGHEYSAFLVGYFFCRGIGVEADQAKANDWFAKSNKNLICR